MFVGDRKRASNTAGKGAEWYPGTRDGARGKDETQMVVGNQDMVICLAPIHVCQTSSARRVRYGALGNIASKAVVKYILTI